MCKYAKITRINAFIVNVGQGLGTVFKLPLGTPYSTTYCLDSGRGSAFYSSFLLICALGGSRWWLK